MTAEALLSWRAPGGQRMISLVFGHAFLIGADEACLPTAGFELQREPVDHPRPQRDPDAINPAALARDSDLYAWRERTDLVIRGVARSPRPTRSLQLGLRCRGSEVAFRLGLEIHGDRWVERGPAGLRLSEAELFDEMPISYDRAYGGTDEGARARRRRSWRDELILAAVGPEEFRQSSRFTYPRNPVGKGYVVDDASAVGTAWPNIEFSDDRLSLDKLVAPREHWGRRPYPAGFDWVSHRWFPRCAMLGVKPPGATDAVPDIEAALGILDLDHLQKPRLKRIRHQLAQGAHPYLWRHRLLGDEYISVDAMGEGGAPLGLRLPGLRPMVRIRPLGAREQRAPAELDLVYVEAEQRRVSLLWRAAFPVERDPLPPGWEGRCPHEIRW